MRRPEAIRILSLSCCAGAPMSTRGAWAPSRAPNRRRRCTRRPSTGTWRCCDCSCKPRRTLSCPHRTSARCVRCTTLPARAHAIACACCSRWERTRRRPPAKGRRRSASRRAIHRWRGYSRTRCMSPSKATRGAPSRRPSSSLPRARGCATASPRSSTNVPTRGPQTARSQPSCAPPRGATLRSSRSCCSRAPMSTRSRPAADRRCTARPARGPSERSGCSC